MVPLSGEERKLSSILGALRGLILTSPFPEKDDLRQQS